MGILCDVEDDGLVDHREVYVDDVVHDQQVYDVEDVNEVSSRNYVEEVRSGHTP